MSNVPKVHRHLPLVKVKFQNIETPGADLFCSWGPDTKHIGSYHFLDGKVYDVPQEYVDFLNDRNVKVYGNETDPKSGLERTVVVGTKSRFSFHEVKSRAAYKQHPAGRKLEMKKDKPKETANAG